MDSQTSEEKNLEELAALFNDHQITDENGEVIPEAEEATAQNTAAAEEETSDEQTPSAEKPAIAETPSTQESASDDQNELGVDESGKRYVPEERLKKETKKYRETERKLKALEDQLAKGNALLQSATNPKSPLPEPERTFDKADVLELKLTKPQFNPASPDYNRTLDEMAFRIYKADPTLSIMEAAEQAESYAKEISQSIAGARAEARQVKTLQADQGIAGRSGRQETTPDTDAMSDQELEAYLKKTGQW